MSSAKLCSHSLGILNFDRKDTVSYPIVRIIGRAENCKQVITCQAADDHLQVHYETADSVQSIHPIDSIFKILVELREGENKLTFLYGCQKFILNLEYSPLNFQQTVMPMYVVCDGHDGLFQAPPGEMNDVKSACDRILLCAKLLQCFTAEKLLENGFGRKTFSLEGQCQVFRSTLNYMQAREMKQDQLWETIGREIMNSPFASDKRKYLAFLSCTNYRGAEYSETAMASYQDLLNITEGYVALGGGGLALFGTACLYTWPVEFKDIEPKFQDKTKVDRTQFLDDSCYRGTRGACFSTTLGSVLHELYHTFDLGHTENGVMGRGFDNIGDFFVSSAHSKEEAPKNHETNIEFKEEFESEFLSKRLISENKKKDFQVFKKYEEIDKTTLSKSCCVILAYHRWFNDYKEVVVALTYDHSNKLIRSTAGIRVVELRRQLDELIYHNWTFEGKVLKFSFSIPNEVFAYNIPIKLFVEDNYESSFLTVKQKRITFMPK